MQDMVAQAKQNIRATGGEAINQKLLADGILLKSAFSDLTAQLPATQDILELSGDNLAGGCSLSLSPPTP